ncbi:LuxR C-terminal-related transcriptional regulator, partial [Geodermatophilus sp. CPCC 205506]
ALGVGGVLRRAGAALAARGLSDAPRETVRRRTATERRVLQLCEAGLGVHEVAQRLFLTPGTVHAVLDAAGGGDEVLRFLSSPPADAVGQR